ncbi:DUF5458 family protein [Niabella sp. W65]|nr:DUF5458 family protein [Niabella sp. W65]MCH7367164.1 DUF5458 family protein [Niabella sp. W65]ULT46069.1 DUF5458 family protein [Niabella sp. I65]
MDNVQNLNPERKARKKYSWKKPVRKRKEKSLRKC